jgi:broad specificity phosphatase PhoE
MREGVFASPNEPLDEGGHRKAAQHRLPGPKPDRTVTSPALAARQTAGALLAGAEVDAAIRDIDPGAWSGRALADIHETDGQALSLWISDPTRGAPGGETMAQVAARVAGWLADQARSDARIVAITHASVIRAAIALVLDVPVGAGFNIDIAPLSATSLSFNRRWRLQELRLL